ncbi:hypothetical protein [Formosa haliotis]|uniref:hypothetical protein n=1 Tax=Formosa haliotis TaxID=1555194 RepID=UPI003F773103
MGKETTLHYTKGMVEVHYNQQRIAIHQRSGAKGAYITNKDHLSSSTNNIASGVPNTLKTRLLLMVVMFQHVSNRLLPLWIILKQAIKELWVYSTP